MKIVVVNCGSSKVSQIMDLLKKQGVQVGSVDLADANDFDFRSTSGVVLSGGPHLFTSENGYQLIDQFSFLDDLNRPVLGICLGLQAIALRAGARAFRGEERRETEEIRIQKKHPLFNGLEEMFIAGTDHCEGVELPDGFDQIASSEFYEIEALSSQTERLYGVQFHPEISGEVGEVIFRNFCTIVAAS